MKEVQGERFFSPHHTWDGGGIGRHTRLKICWHSCREGSSPSRPIPYILIMGIYQYMGYEIQTAFVYLDDKTKIVKMYFIQGMPFTFDELNDDITSNPEYTAKADRERVFSMEDVYKSSFYLIDEQAHPMIYQVDLENPEELPEDFSEENLPD